MEKNLIAKASTTIDASIEKVSDALVNPKMIKKYMFGSTVSSDWKKGEIKWKGVHEEKKYEDKGKILEIKLESVLKYTHYSPLSGKEDIPKNYNTVTIKLSDKKDGISVVLTQDNNTNEKALKQSEKNWNAMLDGLKELLEKQRACEKPAANKSIAKSGAEGRSIGCKSLLHSIRA
ncbi:MAG: SRPBCC family protein [Ferruginibacter sp.]